MHLTGAQYLHYDNRNENGTNAWSYNWKYIQSSWWQKVEVPLFHYYLKWLCTGFWASLYLLKWISWGFALCVRMNTKPFCNPPQTNINTIQVLTLHRVLWWEALAFKLMAEEQTENLYSSKKSRHTARGCREWNEVSLVFKLADVFWHIPMSFTFNAFTKNTHLKCKHKRVHFHTFHGSKIDSVAYDCRPKCSSEAKQVLAFGKHNVYNVWFQIFCPKIATRL